MADVFDDPRFPDRPQHQDFYRLMEVVSYLDGEAVEGGREPDSIMQGLFDEGSVMYMAVQRARRMHQQTGIHEVPLATMWLEAFTVGVLFEQRGGTRPS